MSAMRAWCWGRRPGWSPPAADGPVGIALAPRSGRVRDQRRVVAHAGHDGADVRPVAPAGVGGELVQAAEDLRGQVAADRRPGTEFRGGSVGAILRVFGPPDHVYRVGMNKVLVWRKNLLEDVQPPPG